MDTHHHFQIAAIALRDGSVKGWYCFYWLLKILVPVSFFAFSLNAFGLLERVDFILGPVMNLLHLPSAAAIPLVMGICTGTAGTVAAISAIPFTHEQMTLIAIFSLISHNMIQEGIIQAKSGSSFILSIAVRLITSVVTVLIVSSFWGGAEPHVATTINRSEAIPLKEQLFGWLTDTFVLLVIVFAIIMLMNIMFELMKAYGVIEKLNRIIRPLLNLFGLEPEVGVLWLTSSFIGLAYGGAMIVQEVKTNQFSESSIRRLHFSAGINHAIIEEPLMFLPLGIHPVMLWVPRLVAAAVVVHLLRLWLLIIPLGKGRN